MGTTPWVGGHKDVRESPNNPAAYISWNDMQVFIHSLNQAAGDSLYRLPTEAEWEYACRAGTTMRWSFGDDESQLGQYAWYLDNACGVEECYPHAVGTKLPNPWGLYDMHGNVAEWVQDWRWPYPSDAQTDPQGPDKGNSRVLRGGSAGTTASVARSANRYGVGPGDHAGGLGARLLRIGPIPGTAVTPQSWGEVKDQSR